jgi:hypothetical protein
MFLLAWRASWGKEHVIPSPNETKTSIKWACGDRIMIRFVNLSLRVTQWAVLIARSAWDIVRTTRTDQFHDTKPWKSVIWYKCHTYTTMQHWTDCSGLCSRIQTYTTNAATLKVGWGVYVSELRPTTDLLFIPKVLNESWMDIYICFQSLRL